MKRSLYILFVCAFSLNPVFSQNEINQTDAEGNRHGVWKKNHPGTKILRYEGQFEHGKEVGVFKFYCEDCNGKPAVIKTFNPDNNIAEVKYYTVSGKLVSEGKMDGKMRVGDWVYYQKKSNGILTKEYYENGELDGVKSTYYASGQLAEEVSYKNGRKQGENNYYSPTGVLLKKLLYVDDELHGPAKHYDAGANLTIDGQYKDGKKDGIWRYYKDGKLQKEETFPKPRKKLN